MLLVDDDPLILKVIRLALESEGHRVKTMEDGGEAVASFLAAQARDPYTVVLTDLDMPLVDGHAVAQAIKSAAPATPVVLLTGWSEASSEERPLPVNVDALLCKPPKLSQLRQVFQQIHARTR